VVSASGSRSVARIGVLQAGIACRTVAVLSFVPHGKRNIRKSK
jgi:hypothetical protein